MEQELKFSKEVFKELLDFLVERNKAKELFYGFNGDGIADYISTFYNLKYPNASEEEWDKFYEELDNYCCSNSEQVYLNNRGDGRPVEYVFGFSDFPDLFVQLKGTYSSYDSTDFHSVKFVKPYQHTETRYK